jgi:hypothetical protein
MSKTDLSIPAHDVREDDYFGGKTETVSDASWANRDGIESINERAEKSASTDTKGGN